MLIGALGDIHGAFETVEDIMTRHSDVSVWVSVGDVADNDGQYFTPIAPLHWIKGNNEDFDVIAAAMAGRPPAPRLHYLPNGGPYQVGPWRVAALGGTFAPSWYHTPAAALPPSRGRKTTASSLKLGKSRDDKRRHFVRDEVAACKALTGIDVFLTHEAPRPFYRAIGVAGLPCLAGTRDLSGSAVDRLDPQSAGSKTSKHWIFQVDLPANQLGPGWRRRIS